jgi:hypothetical protein
MPPKGPYKLVTVNTAPARAKIIIGRVVEAVKETYTIDYVANSTRTSSHPTIPARSRTDSPLAEISDVREIVSREKPDLLVRCPRRVFAAHVRRDYDFGAERSER